MVFTLLRSFLIIPFSLELYNFGNLYSSSIFLSLLSHKCHFHVIELVSVAMLFLFIVVVLNYNCLLRNNICICIHICVIFEIKRE